MKKNWHAVVGIIARVATPHSGHVIVASVMAGATHRGYRAGAEGLEPPAYGFGDRRSTN